ncbi:MAG TPA: hypothetical protein VLF71_03030 [Candidatus Saccharimonadales bacterium]|nr:hypothetical protein [Candidatus Saccharimonadales bacterium]
MFGFFDGLKMRLMALMAMLIAAGPATAVVAKTTPPHPSVPKTLSAQTSLITPTPPAPATPPKTPPPVVTPVVIPPPITTPAPEDPTPTPPKPTCGCTKQQLHRHMMCPMVCSDSQTQ